MLLLLLCQAAACLRGLHRSLEGQIDLRAFYAAGTMVRTGDASRLYDYNFARSVQDRVVGPRSAALPFLYPPFAALLFVPLSLVSYHASFYILFLINITFLLVAAGTIRPWLPQGHTPSWLALASSYGCLFGVSIALMQGQISLLMLLIYCGTYVLLRKDRPGLAGVLFSLALIKFQLALPIWFLFIVWKQWRFVAGFLNGALCTGLVSFMVAGRVGMTSYAHSLISMVIATARDPTAGKVRFGMLPTDMPNIHGMTYALSHGASWGPVLNVVLCCVVLGWASRQKASLLLAVPTAMLVSYHMQPHDLTLLLLPLSFISNMLRWRPYVPPDSTCYWCSTVGISLISAAGFLVLPGAAFVMISNRNYMVSIAVAGIMIIVVKAGPSYDTSTCVKSGTPNVVLC